MNLKIERKSGDVPIPTYAKKGDAGIDLTANEYIAIPSKGKAIVSTGLKVEIPRGHVGLIWDRSGIAAKNGIHCLAGVIDSEYRGEVKIVMVNLGNEEFDIEQGMRIAQLIIQPYVQCKIEDSSRLSKTNRGKNGFGSTGR